MSSEQDISRRETSTPEAIRHAFSSIRDTIHADAETAGAAERQAARGIQEEARFHEDRRTRRPDGALALKGAAAVRRPETRRDQPSFRPSPRARRRHEELGRSQRSKLRPEGEAAR